MAEDDYFPYDDTYDYSYYYSDYNMSDYNDTTAFHHHHEDYLRGHQVYKWMIVTCIIPVCIVGLGANTVSVWVWCASRKPTPVVMFFQCLGVLDNIFLLGSAIRGGLYYMDQATPAVDKFLAPLLYLSQTLSVHVTLAISIFRWFAVTRQTQRVTRRHVIVTCVVVTSWCSLLTALLVVMMNVVHEKATYVSMLVLAQVMGFVLPVLALLGFSFSLLRIICQLQRQESNNDHKKLTMAVLGIAACSFLACPVGVWAHILPVLVNHNAENGCKWTCLFTAFGTADLLQVLNSSVNFIFYLVFASRFRPLLRRSVRCLGGVRRTGLRFSGDPEVELVTMDSISSTISSGTHQRDASEEHTDAIKGPTAAQEDPAERKKGPADATEARTEANETPSKP